MRLVVAGAGGPQFLLLEAIRARRVRADDIVVAAPATHLHPPMVPGWLAGRYDDEDITVDVRRLAEGAGCRYIEARVTSLDAGSRSLTLDNGTTLSYDVLSLTPTDLPAGLDIPGAARTVDVCPLQRARRILPAIAQARAAAGTRTVAVAVAGAGITGFEIAVAIQERMQRDDPGVTVMLVDPAERLLPEHEAGLRRRALGLLERKRIGVALGARVIEVTPRGLTLTSGAVVPADVIVWCLGVAPAAMLATSGLTLDSRGFVQTDAALRSVSHPEVILAPAQCFRAGRVIAHNLAVATGTLPGKAMKPVNLRPPRIILVDAGATSALIALGKLARSGGWARRMKDVLDRRLVARFQRDGGVRRRDQAGR